MKIGIITFADVPNFGANLQALSTVCYLRNHGHNPVLIRWEPIDFEERFTKIRTDKQPKAHFDFCAKYLPWTDVCRNDDEIVAVIEKNNIEAIIIGSDAVLQHHSLLSRIQFPTKTVVRITEMTSERVFPNAFWGTFYLKLRHKVPMAIMSASSQNSQYRYLLSSTTKSMTECLQRFKYVSVRDTWTRDMIEFISHGKICPQITPDPVFAFNENCENLIPPREAILKKFSLPEQYVLVSMKCRLLHNVEWMDGLKKCFADKGLHCVALPMPTGIDFEHNFDYAIDSALSPLDWYALIKYANGYVGENMHPIVVCLHNATPCFCFDTYGVLKYARMYCDEPSSKIYDIMSNFSLLQNRCNAYSRFWKCPTPREVVDKILSFDVQKCLDNSQRKLKEYKQMMNDIETSLVCE